MASSPPLSPSLALAALASMVFLCLPGAAAPHGNPPSHPPKFPPARSPRSPVPLPHTSSSSPSPSFSPPHYRSHPSPSSSPSPSPSHPHKASPLSPTPVQSQLLSRKSNDLLRGKTLGIVLVSIAGLLQAVVVVFLFVKRKQMLKTVRSYELNGPSENWHEV